MTFAKSSSVPSAPFDRMSLTIRVHQSLMQAGQFVHVIEERQGLKIGCIEEIAYRQGFISRDQLHRLAEPLIKSGYGKYLLNLIND